MSDAASPYLRRAEGHPVAWRPWGRDAFDEAERLNRPVFLVIGTFASQACFILDRDVLADPEVAARLNERFICVRADGDDRPDVQGRYLRLYQIAMEGRGVSLPLLAFLTPGGDLFFASPSIPARSRGGGPGGLVNLLDQAGRLWAENGLAICRDAASLTDLLATLPRTTFFASDEPSSATVAAVQRALLSASHPRYPGFGPIEGPRFPSHPALEFLLEQAVENDDADARRLVLDIARAMLRGAITDPLDGGLHRYTIDGLWEKPRFEKTLAVNASHLAFLARLQQATPDPEFDEAMRETWDFLRRRMRLADGAFAAAIAAGPSDGEPLDYWGWSREQVDRLLPEDGARLAALLWGLPDSAQNDDKATTPIMIRRAALRRAGTLEQAAATMRRLKGPELAALRDETRRLLLAARDQRPAPPVDSRLFTAAHARLASALFLYAKTEGEAAKSVEEGTEKTGKERAGTLALPSDFARTRDGAPGSASVPVRSLSSNSPRRLDEALAIIKRFERDARRSDGLMARGATLDGKPFGDGPFLQDQAAWLGALLDAHEATGDAAWLARADALGRRTLEVFSAPGLDALSDRPSTASLAASPADFADDPTTGPIRVPVFAYEDTDDPAPAPEFALQLIRLSRATGDAALEERAWTLLRPATAAVQRAGRLYPTWARAVRRVLPSVPSTQAPAPNRSPRI